jgi:hypothetical protein
MDPQIPSDVSDFVKAFCTAVARDRPDLPAAIDLRLDTEIGRAKVAAMLAAIPEFGRAYPRRK